MRVCYVAYAGLCSGRLPSCGRVQCSEGASLQPRGLRCTICGSLSATSTATDLNKADDAHAFSANAVFLFEFLTSARFPCTSSALRTSRHLEFTRSRLGSASFAHFNLKRSHRSGVVGPLQLCECERGQLHCHEDMCQRGAQWLQQCEICATSISQINPAGLACSEAVASQHILSAWLHAAVYIWPATLDVHESRCSSVGRA